MTESILTKLIINCETGEESIVPLTEEEIQDREQMALSISLAQQAHQEAESLRSSLKESAKLKLIAGQPLTAEEAEVLVI